MAGAALLHAAPVEATFPGKNGSVVFDWTRVQGCTSSIAMTRRTGGLRRVGQCASRENSFSVPDVSKDGEWIAYEVNEGQGEADIELDIGLSLSLVDLVGDPLSVLGDIGNREGVLPRRALTDAAEPARSPSHGDRGGAPLDPGPVEDDGAVLPWEGRLHRGGMQQGGARHERAKGGPDPGTAKAE